MFAETTRNTTDTVYVSRYLLSIVVAENDSVTSTAARRFSQADEPLGRHQVLYGRSRLSVVYLNIHHYDCRHNKARNDCHMQPMEGLQAV